MFTAFSTGLTALNADATAVSVTGNNIANLNTTGFKTSNVIFSDLVSQNLGGGKTQVGMGVQTPTTQRVFAGGVIQSTSSPLDVAISGQGFLVVKSPGDGQTEYTRAGNLQKDKDGNLLTATGEHVQGYSAAGVLGDVVIPPNLSRAAQPTANVSLNMNLDSSGTSFSYPVGVHDSQGGQHTVTLNFAKDSANNWTWTANSNGDGTTTGTGKLVFDKDGNLTTPAAGADNGTIKVTGITGVNDLNINIHFLDGAGNPNVTQYVQQSGVQNVSQDGHGAGNLSDVSIADGGKVVASYDNGDTVTVAQLAVASFVNPESLVAFGNNNFRTTIASSEPAMGIPGTGGRGQIKGSSLEASTVDIATEFTHLMTYQNSYQAASRIITTANSMTQQTINLIGANG